MEAKSLGARYRKQTYPVVAVVGLLILSGFTIVEYVRNNMAAMWTDVAIALILAGSLLAFRFGNDDQTAFRLGCWGSAIGLLCLVVTGDGLLYYQLIFPLLAFYFLGRREGMVLVGIFLVGLAWLMSAAELGFGNVYRTENTVRFLVAFCFVSVIGWRYEKSRERFHALLATTNESLQHEKNQLQEALNHVREKDLKLERSLSNLNDQTQLMQTVFDNMDEGVAVSDEEGQLIIFNPSAERILGMGAVESRPDDWSKVYGAFYLDKETRVPTDQLPLMRALRGESTDGMELFVRNEKNREGAYVRAKGRFISNDAGANKKVKAGIVVFSDITHHKKQEAQLQETINQLKRQAQLMETVFRSVSDGVVVTSKEGEFLFVNPNAEHIVGMGSTEVPSDQWAATYGTFYPDKETPVPSDDLPLIRAMRGEASDDVELFIRNPDRPEGVCISVSGRPLQDETGTIEGGVIVLRDITNLKAAESELKRTVDRLQEQTQLMETVFNSMDEGIIVGDVNGHQLFRNPSADRISGTRTVRARPSEWAKVYGIFHPDKDTYLSVNDNPLVRATRGIPTDNFEAFVRNEYKPDGVYVSVIGRPLHNKETDEVTAGVIVFRDITKTKETEAQLKQTITELRSQTHAMETIFNSVSDGVVAVDEKQKTMIFNPSAKRILGMHVPDTSFSQWAATYGIHSLDGKALLPEDELPLVRAVRGEASDGVELLVRNRKKPEGVYISVNGRPLRDDSGTVIGGVVTLRDVTDVKNAESELRQSADNLRNQTHAMETIFNSISDGVVVADEKGDFTVFNPSAERIVGIGSTDTGPDQWTEKYGIFFPDRETPIPMEELPLVRAIQGEASDEVEMFLRNPNVPEGVFISVSGRPLHDDSGMTRGGVIVFRDVSERIQAEEALSQAFAQGKLEIVDTILHNIGNAINSVAVGVGTVRDQLARNELIRRFSALAKAIEAHREDWIPYLQTDPQGQKVMPFIIALSKDFAAQNARLGRTVERVEDRVAHIVDIVRTQRSLDTGTMARKDINLRKAITDAAKLLNESLSKRGVEIQVDCQNAPKEIRTQESKFHQMLVNLIKNAIEAIDDLEKSKGLQAKPSIQIRSYVQEDFLVVDVTDNGIGIEEKRSKIIFAAGYTTKEKGSGLGLHSIANFVIGSGGQIQPVSDGIGKGTTMRVKLRLVSVTPKPRARKTFS